MTYNFRYSKFAPGGILSILFIAILSAIGVLISIVILFYIINYRILRASELNFWKQHQEFVLYSIIWLPIAFGIIFSFIASILYRHLIDIKNGELNIFNNYAVLYYKGKEIVVERGRFSIIYDKIWFVRNLFSPILYKYTIITEDKKYKLYESIQEVYEITTFSQRRKKIYIESSLFIAMEKLKKLVKNKSNEIKNEVFSIGDVQITINVSTLEVFENTNYFVDIENALPIKDVPFIVCDIYENKDSNHLIGELGLLDDEKNDKLPVVEELKKRVIVSVLELNEYIKK